MKRLMTAALALSLLAPATATADPNRSDRQNAAEECREMRSDMGRSDFAEKFGTNRNNRNAFGKCVSQQARKKEGERRDEGERKRSRGHGHEQGERERSRGRGHS